MTQRGLDVVLSVPPIWMDDLLCTGERNRSWPVSHETDTRCFWEPELLIGSLAGPSFSSGNMARCCRGLPASRACWQQTRGAFSDRMEIARKPYCTERLSHPSQMLGEDSSKPILKGFLLALSILFVECSL